jgi:hypothetical protein
MATSDVREIVLGFNNPFDEPMKTELIFDTARLHDGVTVALQLPGVRLSRRLRRNVRGTLPCWRAKRWKHPLPQRRTEFAKRTFVARPGKAIRVSGVRLDAKESVNVRLLIDVKSGGLDRESARLPVLQRVHGRVVGGSTIEVRFRHEPPLHRPGKKGQLSVFDPDFAKAEADKARGRRPAWMEYMLAERASEP